jgi:hypothetical protein
MENHFRLDAEQCGEGRHCLVAQQHSEPLQATGYRLQARPAPKPTSPRAHSLPKAESIAETGHHRLIAGFDRFVTPVIPGDMLRQYIPEADRRNAEMRSF